MPHYVRRDKEEMENAVGKIRLDLKWQMVRSAIEVARYTDTHYV